MLAIDRRLYCKQEDQDAAYQDSPLSLGYGVTISAPHMHAHCLELLVDYLQPGNKALDIGSGSGYLVACMQQMVAKTGKAYGIEYIKEIYEQSLINLKSDPVSAPLLNSSIIVKRKWYNSCCILALEKAITS